MTISVTGTEEAIAAFKALGADMRKARQDILKGAAKPLVSAGKSAAPRSNAPHSRYNTSKATKRIKAPRGMGKKVATYYPGNLSRSMRLMQFARAKSKVFVGARLSRNPTGAFKGSRVDGWYMHFIENGTSQMSARRWWQPTAEAQRQTVEQKIVDGFEKIVNQYNSKA